MQSFGKIWYTSLKRSPVWPEGLLKMFKGINKCIVMGDLADHLLVSVRRLVRYLNSHEIRGKVSRVIDKYLVKNIIKIK